MAFIEIAVVELIDNFRDAFDKLQVHDPDRIEVLMSIADTVSPSANNRYPQLPTCSAVPGGTFRMGSNTRFPEEAPVHRVAVEGVRMDRTPVTNHVTLAEIAPDPKDYAGALPNMLKAGSLVFVILVFWLSAIFVSFTLVARAYLIATASLLACAVSFACAIFSGSGTG